MRFVSCNDLLDDVPDRLCQLDHYSYRSFIIERGLLVDGGLSDRPQVFEIGSSMFFHVVKVVGDLFH